jgi:hypothetical protein
MNTLEDIRELFNGIYERYPEIRQLEHILENSTDIAEKAKACFAAAELRKKIHAEMNVDHRIEKHEYDEWFRKLLAVCGIDEILENLAGLTSEEEFIRKHNESVRKLKSRGQDFPIKVVRK